MRIQLMLKIIIPILLFLSVLPSFGQKKEKLPCIDKKFSIVAHIAIDKLGTKSTTPSEIQTALIELNSRFSNICISFEVCEYRYIDLTNYYAPYWDAVKILYNVNNRVNMYFGVMAGIHYGGDGDFMGVIDTSSSGLFFYNPSGESFVHNMGHFFGLTDTNEGSGSELVNGSNCKIDGDSICDTPSDPYLNGDTVITKYIDFKCNYIFTRRKDANDEYYTPKVCNAMSFYSCGIEFTYDQYMKMAKTYLSKTGMW